MNKDEINALLKKADQGDAEAQVTVGLKYNMGEDVELDKALAFSYFKKAADQENAGGLFGVGMCYWNGEGVEVDVWKAKEYLQKAVEKGHRGAAIYLREIEAFILESATKKAAESQEKIDGLIKSIKSDAEKLKGDLEKILNDLEKKNRENGFPEE